MDTKEKLEKKLDITKKKILGTLLAVQENDSKKARKNMAEELNLGMDTIGKLLYEMKTYKKDKKDYKMVSYFSKITSSGVNINISELEEKVKKSKATLYDSINMAKYESFISEIDSECLSKEILSFLKSSNVDEKIYQKAMQKYVSNLKLNLDNADDTFEFLYENNYKPQNNKSTLDKIFKYYVECKSKDGVIQQNAEVIKQKDEKIAELEQQLLEKDEIIFGKCNMINDLNTKVKSYEQTIPYLKLQIQNYAESAQKSEFNVKQLQKQLEARERTGLLKIAFQKVKLLFQKDKPVQLSASLKGIQNDISNLSLGLSQVESTIFEPQIQASYNKTIEKQNKSATKAYKLDELSMSR